MKERGFVLGVDNQEGRSGGRRRIDRQEKSLQSLHFSCVDKGRFLKARRRIKVLGTGCNFIVSFNV
jgi:hypothetical protein